MSHQRNLKRSLMDSTTAEHSPKDNNSTPYKRRKQTTQALEALGQLFKDSSMDELEQNKFNKNDILSLTLSRLLRSKYWPSHLPNINVPLTSGLQSSSVVNDLTGFLLVLNTSGRIILISDNVEYYLRKNVRSLYPQLTSIYECVSPDDHDAIHQMLASPTIDEKRAICTWILPRGKRPNRSHTETKSMLLTGHYFVVDDDLSQEPLFVARCEQILSSTPNVPTNSIGSTSTTTLRFVLTDQLNIGEISANTEFLLGYQPNELIDQSIHRILPIECSEVLEQAKQYSFSGEHCTSMNVLDIFTRQGDRLSFLCNTHMIIEGRRKTMKLGFLAQLIDPAIRYDCLIYANKQNVERQKTSMQQESIFMSNMILNNSTTANVAMSPNDQCVSMNDLPKAKRQRVRYQCLEKENFVFFDRYQPIGQVPYEAHYNHKYVSSPTQELDHVDEVFHWIEEENSKSNHPRSAYHLMNEGYQYHELGPFTPSLTELHFF